MCALTVDFASIELYEIVRTWLKMHRVKLRAHVFTQPRSKSDIACRIESEHAHMKSVARTLRLFALAAVTRPGIFRAPSAYSACALVIEAALRRPRFARDAE